MCFQIYLQIWILWGILFGTNLSLTPSFKGEDSRPLCECGSSLQSMQTRVVGGKNAPPGDFPYATGLFITYGETLGRQSRGRAGVKPYCGGTLVTDRHVLTAAHCVRDRAVEDIGLDVGEYNIADAHERRTLRNVKSFKMHPQYIAKMFRNDIAVIELSTPVKLGEETKAAWLPPQGLSLSAGTPVTVYGWGRLSYSSGRPEILQMLQMPVVSNSECQKRLYTRLTPNMMCAGGQEGKDACGGDSGSGLTTQGSDENVLVGVVSFGKRCALPGVAGVYTKVSSFVNWIYESTKSSSCRPCIASPQDFV